MHPSTYRAAINRAIAHTGLRVVACARHGGYSYFKDKEGNQVGESVPVYRQSDQSLAAWVRDAEQAAKDGAKDGAKEKAYWGAFKT